MGVYASGKDGQLFIDGTQAAKVQSWSFSSTQAVLETTSLEDTDRTLIAGVSSFKKRHFTVSFKNKVRSF